MNCQLSVPAKTFILGEYLVLRGGKSILLTSHPSFVLNVTKGENKTRIRCKHIHNESPAGDFINRHLNFYQNFNLEFFDPYKGIGGLGASSAQFALIYALKMQLKKLVDEDLFHALEAYSHSAWNGEGIAPSGADIIAQLKGGLCLFHPEKQTIKNMEWPFSSLDYCLIHTNNKIATHNHLKSLDGLDVKGLANIVEDGLNSLEKKDAGLFAESIRRYRERLEQKQLVLHETQMIVSQIESLSFVLAAKGCGALCADIIFVLLESESKEFFRAWCTKKNLRIIYLGQELGNGLKWKCF